MTDKNDKNKEDLFNKESIDKGDLYSKEDLQLEKFLKRREIKNNICCILLLILMATIAVGAITNNERLFLCSFVGVFVVVGVLTSFNKVRSHVPLRKKIMSAIGILYSCFAVLCIIDAVKKNDDIRCIYFGLSIFALPPVLKLISDLTPTITLLVKMREEKRQCTQPADAFCSGIKEKPGYTINVNYGNSKSQHFYRYTMMFCPTYEMYLNVDIIDLCDERYGVFGIPEKDEKREIMINPDNPQHFYDYVRYREEFKFLIKKTLQKFFSAIAVIIVIGIIILKSLDT